MKVLSIIMLVLLMTGFVCAEKYMALSKKGAMAYVRLTDIDSIIFIDSAAPIQGTILYTKPFFHRVDEFNTDGIGGVPESDNDIGINGGVCSGRVGFGSISTDYSALNSVLLTSLYNASGQNLGIKTGDTLLVQASIRDNMGLKETRTGEFVVIDNPYMAGPGESSIIYRVATLAQFLLAIPNFLSQNAWNMGAGSNAAGVKIGIVPDGEIRIDNRGSAASIEDLFITSTNTLSSVLVSTAFYFNQNIAANGFSDTPERMLRPAIGEDQIFNPLYYDALGAPLPSGSSGVQQIFCSDGEALDIQDGDTIAISSLVGFASKSSSNLFIKEGVTLNDPSTTTLQNILDKIRNTLNLPVYDNSPSNNPSVSIADGKNAILMPAGAMVIRGQPGIGFEITNFSLTAKSATGSPVAKFNQNCTVTEY